MTFLIAWLVFPAVMAALTLGCGLALERAAGARIPGSLLVPAGLAVIVVAGALATSTSATTKLAAPLVVVLAAAGLALSPPWEQRERFDGWAIAAAAGVFAVFAAPVVLSGEATWTGYIKLDDTATWLAFTDRVIVEGRSFAGLAPSTYEALLAHNFGLGYPIGAFLPLGVGSRVINQDPAWVFQPFLAFTAATLALSLNAILLRAVPRPKARALCAFVAAQPALLFGYAQWGGIKELVTAAVVALVVALVPVAVVPGARVRAALPLAMAGAAMLAIVSAAGVVWLLPGFALALAATLRRAGRRAAAKLAGALTVAGAALAVPSLLLAGTFLAEAKQGSGGTFRSETVLGNLFGRLDPLQLVGVWPTGDFRLRPDALAATYVLIAIVVIAAGVGIVIAVRRRAWELAVYSVAIPAIGLAVIVVASPWVGAKTLAIASPALMLAACSGCAGVWTRGRRGRLAAGVLAAAIGGGVLWSNALAYRDVTLAPADQLADLEHIGELAAGQGPTLMTEYNPYGARHFLRLADAEGATELRRRLVALRNGQIAPAGTWPDTDELQFDGLAIYRTLVLRRSPAASRPPAMYHLVWRGRTYELWQRSADRAVPLEHLSLGGPVSPVARPSCAEVRRLAASVGRDGVLATVERPATISVGLGGLQRPASWGPSGDPTMVFPVTSGVLSAPISVDKPARYEVWLGGSFYGRIVVTVDGKRVGEARHRLNNGGGYTSFGTLQLRPGRHRVTITNYAGGLRPGSDGNDSQPFAIGPLILSHAGDSRAVTYVRGAQASRLCGRQLDWIEALPGGK